MLFCATAGLIVSERTLAFSSADVLPLEDLLDLKVTKRRSSGQADTSRSESRKPAKTEDLLELKAVPDPCLVRTTQALSGHLRSTKLSVKLRRSRVQGSKRMQFRRGRAWPEVST